MSMQKEEVYSVHKSTSLYCLGAGDNNNEILRTKQFMLAWHSQWQQHIINIVGTYSRIKNITVIINNYDGWYHSDVLTSNNIDLKRSGTKISCPLTLTSA